MDVTKETRTVNPAGSPKLTEATPDNNYKRGDFFRDLKKLTKKRDRPSRPDQEKR